MAPVLPLAHALLSRPFGNPIGCGGITHPWRRAWRRVPANRLRLDQPSSVRRRTAQAPGQKRAVTVACTFRGSPGKTRWTKPTAVKYRSSSALRSASESR